MPTLSTNPLNVKGNHARAIDAALARTRGEHVRDLVNEILALLVASDLLDVRKVEDARVAMFHTVCDALYGNLAVEIPPLRAARSRPMTQLDDALAYLDATEHKALALLERIRQQRAALLTDAARDALDILAARADRDPDFLIDRRDVREWEIDERAVQRRRVPQV